MTMMATIYLFDAWPVMTRFRLSRPMIAVSYTRSHSYSRSQRDDGTGAQENDRVSERWYRLSLAASVQYPAGSHHDVDLKQHGAKVGGLYQLRYPGVWTKRRSRSARHCPKRDGSDVKHDAGGEHQRCGPAEHHSGPNQLE